MFSSRELGLFGLGISIVGTLLMLWGGLEAFIVVKGQTTGDSKDVGFTIDPNAPTSIKVGNSLLVFTDHDCVKLYIYANKIGKGFLAAGLVLQFIALYIDP